MVVAIHPLRFTPAGERRIRSGWRKLLNVNPENEKGRRLVNGVQIHSPIYDPFAKVVSRIVVQQSFGLLIFVAKPY
jgi:hypothetical protein